MKHEIQYLLQVISCKRLYWSLFITEGEGAGGAGGEGRLRGSWLCKDKIDLIPYETLQFSETPPQIGNQLSRVPPFILCW